MIKEVIKLSPVPITFVKEIQSSHPDFIAKGRYRYNRGLYRECIEVVKKLCPQDKIGVLLHEIGHARCNEDGCSCAKINTWLGEYHAEIFALEWLLKNKQKKALGYRMQAIKDHDLGIYLMAGRAIMNTDLWAKCVDYVGLSWIRRLIKKITG